MTHGSWDGRAMRSNSATRARVVSRSARSARIVNGWAAAMCFAIAILQKCTLPSPPPQFRNASPVYASSQTSPGTHSQWSPSHAASANRLSSDTCSLVRFMQIFSRIVLTRYYRIRYYVRVEQMSAPRNEDDANGKYDLHPERRTNDDHPRMDD